MLLSDDPNTVAVGSATINIMNLLAKHKGYLYVPIITDLRQHLISHRRSLPDLMTKAHRNLRADENPEFTRTPCFIIAATAISSYREHERRGSKIQQLTGSGTFFDENELKKNNQTQFKVLPKLPLPKNLKIIQWTDSIENKLKQITTNNIDTSEFRQAVKTNKKIFVNSNYFATKKDEKSVRELIANTILNCWKKMLDAYTKSNKNTAKSFKHTLLSIMSKLYFSRTSLLTSSPFSSFNVVKLYKFLTSPLLILLIKVLPLRLTSDISNDL